MFTFNYFNRNSLYIEVISYEATVVKFQPITIDDFILLLLHKYYH